MKIKHRIFGIMLIIIVSLLMLFCSQSKEIPAEYLPGRGMTLSSSNVVKHEKLLGSINFLGVPDDQEIRKIISDEPPVEVVIISKVQMTTADIFDERLTAYRSLPTQRVGRYLYFARISTDAYVFPDSTPEKPHIIRYNKTKRFVAYIYTAEEKEAITQERRRRIRYYLQVMNVIHLCICKAKTSQAFFCF